MSVWGMFSPHLLAFAQREDMTSLSLQQEDDYWVKQILSSSWQIQQQHKGSPAMAPHSSNLAWKIPWMEKPGRLQSMGSLRVRHNLAT